MSEWLGGELAREEIGTEAVVVVVVRVLEELARWGESETRVGCECGWTRSRRGRRLNRAEVRARRTAADRPRHWRFQGDG